ncbi:MAG TPA: hypothetical protein VLY23_05500 [Candidatus Acidoferrum sp.]|nr:hypothetical protein [Candidatus Acidoferrum sp.]
MRTFRAKSGPFSEQPFYEPCEVESICIDELQKVDLYPVDPRPIRIDRFIEKRFGIVPSYEDLPKGLLGFTRFSDKGVVEIVIANALDEEGTQSAERRLRTTLAHEGGHGLLHAHLFALGSRPDSLFEHELATDAPKILCRDGAIQGAGRTVKKPPYRWWEYQANLAMSALLLPETLVAKALEPMLTVQGMLKRLSLPNDLREDAVDLLASLFDVNPVVARIRLEILYPVTASPQMAL